MKARTALIQAFAGFLGLLGVTLLAIADARAQSSTRPCFYNASGQCVFISATNPLPVTLSGGGGGGLAVDDQAAWVQGTSQFTPSGGVFNDSATLSSGQQGTFRLTTKRAQIVDVDTSGNALYSALSSGVITPGSAVPSTAIYMGVNVAGTGRGWTAVNPSGSIYAGQTDVASIAGTTAATNTGNASAGTQRVVLATDQPAVATSPAPTATMGCTSNTVVTAAASTNAANVKASAGTLCDFTATNEHTAIQYVHFYNNSGSPTCNASIIATYAVPPASAAGQLGGLSVPLTFGRAFGTGIGICITANRDGTGNATANGILLNIGYK